MNTRLILLIIFVGLFENIQAQKGEVSISAGPLVSFPQNNKNFFIRLATGVGLEVIGQYNFSNKSSLLLQTTWASYGTTTKISSDTAPKYRRTIYSLKGGYRYQFGTSGFYTNILGGTEKYSANNLTNTSFTLGAGKRFIVKDIYFIDAGIDCISGITDIRLNIKVLFSVFRSPQK